ncbi:glycosyltransferase [Candidatus Woesearchaeota archaeon]|nr:glycosyltransferase [Candidatus Woesearchaeota archaeon]
MEPGISLCMIVKDESQYLRSCLESINPFVDELIIIDTGSTDDTIAIAKEFGAKVSSFEWCDDFSAARNESLKYATKEWILVLDADEQLLLPDFAALRAILQDPSLKDSELIGFQLDQRSYSKIATLKSMPNLVKHPLVSKYPYYVSHKLVRLFKNTPKIRYRYTIHELVEPSIREHQGKILDSSIVIHHFGLLKPASFVSKKIKTYLDLIKKQLANDPENVRFLYLAGLASLEEKKEDEALQYFFEVAKRDPSYKLVHSEIAKVYLGRQQYNLAQQYFETCASIHPENPSPINNLSVTFMHQGKFHKAVQLLKKHVERFPQNAHLRHNLTIAQDKLKETRTRPIQ